MADRRNAKSTEKGVFKPSAFCPVPASRPAPQAPRRKQGCATRRRAETASGRREQNMTIPLTPLPTTSVGPARDRLEARPTLKPPAWRSQAAPRPVPARRNNDRLGRPRLRKWWVRPVGATLADGLPIGKSAVQIFRQQPRGAPLGRDSIRPGRGRFPPPKKTGETQALGKTTDNYS